MKTLYLLRHAKSSWNHPGLSDFERPLVDAGIRRSKKIIRYLKEKHVAVDLIVTSPAVRTLETARLIAAGIDYPVERICKESSLYDAEQKDFLDVIYGTSDEINSLMVVGHNFTITNIVNFFLGAVIDILPTSGLVGVSFNADQWKKIPSAEAKQLFIVFPKMLKS